MQNLETNVNQEIAEIIQSFFTTKPVCRIPHSCFASDPAGERLSDLTIEELPLVNQAIADIYYKQGDNIWNDTQYPSKTQIILTRISLAYQLWLTKHGLSTSQIPQLAPHWPKELQDFFMN